MKKLALLVLIISLPLIGFFQYKNYRRFHPPSDYEYSISSTIDNDYHNQAMVEEYYTKVVEIGAFARAQWNANGIDVRFPQSEIVEEKNASAYYNRLLSRTSYLESKLENSRLLKEEGLSNEDIQLIEGGYRKEDLIWLNSKQGILEIAFGDRSEYVWQVQKKLISKGYVHRLDGLFGTDTQNAIISFQQDHELFASGDITESTFAKLFAE